MWTLFGFHWRLELWNLFVKYFQTAGTTEMKYKNKLIKIPDIHNIH